MSCCLAGESSSNADVLSLGLSKLCCSSVSRYVESVAGGSISKLFCAFCYTVFHPDGITVVLHTHLLYVPGQAGKSKDLGSKEGEAQPLTVALTGLRCDTSQLLDLSSGIELG